MLLDDLKSGSISISLHPLECRILAEACDEYRHSLCGIEQEKEYLLCEAMASAFKAMVYAGEYGMHLEDDGKESAHKHLGVT